MYRNAILRLILVAVLVSAYDLVDAADGASLSVTVTPRKPAFSRHEGWHFDLKVKNPTKVDIKIPYVYDAVLEIDGLRYTQFPKPTVVPETDRTIDPMSAVDHGTVTLNGKEFTTVDASTGKTPLKLKSGEHTITIELGSYRSPKAKFMIKE